MNNRSEKNADVDLPDERQEENSAVFADRRSGWLVIGGFFLLLALLVAVQLFR